MTFLIQLVFILPFILLSFSSPNLTTNLNSSNNINSNKKEIMREKVCIIGSGNWQVAVIGVHKVLIYHLLRGSAIAKIVGNNAMAYPDVFEESVPMWVFEEMVDGKKLTEIINTSHENVK
jgi:hypothetical protein